LWLHRRMTRIEHYIEKKFHIDAKYFIRGGFWLTVTQVTTILFGVASSVVLANHLSEHNFGTYRYLISIGVLFASFSLTGLEAAILQATAKGNLGFYLKMLPISLKYSFLASFLSLSTAVYYLFKQDYILAAGCAIISITYPFLRTHQFLPSFLQGAHLLRENMFFQSARALIISILSILVVLFSSSILLLLTTYLLAQIVINTAGFHLYVKRIKTPAISNDTEIKYLSFAKHTSLRNLIANLAHKWDSVIIFTLLGSVELATYTIASIIPEQIKATFKNIGTLLLHKYSSRDDLSSPSFHNQARKYFILFAFFLFISIIYCFAAPTLYKLLFPKYPEAVIMSQLLALSFPAAISIIPSNLLQLRIAEVRLYRLHIEGSILNIIFTTMLTLHYGLLGAVSAKIISRYTILFLAIYHNHKK
jgi:O-antigen/teichoic acid export membrane protein